MAAVATLGLMSKTVRKAALLLRARMLLHALGRRVVRSGSGARPARARRELAEHVELVVGRRVLELGSGTGVCGILAAKLGAAQVSFSFYRKCIPLQHCRLGSTCMSIGLGGL